MALERKSYRLTSEMLSDLRREAGRRGVAEVDVLREALAREFGRAQARDELAELREVVNGLRIEVASVHDDLRLLLQRLPRRR